MRDLDRLLRESLKSVGDAFAPSDPVAARQRYLVRRRRRFFRMSFGTAVAAATAIALIVYLSPAPDPGGRQPALDVTSRFLAVTQSVPVGDAPSGIDIGGAGVWVANSGDGTVMRINQTSNTIAETVDVGGAPDDVAVGEDAVWVAHRERSVVTKVELSEDGAGAEQTEIEVPLPPQHLDIAFGGDAVWVVAATEGILYRIDADTDEIEDWDGARLASDVAVDGDGTPWTLGRHMGRIVTRSDTRSDARITSNRTITGASGDLGRARTNVDLAAGDEHLWVSLNTGRVLMLDYNGVVREQHDVGGSYTGISTYRGLVWAVTGSGDDEGSGILTRFDDRTGKRVGAPLPLTGRPFDVAVGRTGIWLTHNSTDSTSHISDTGSPAPTPNPTPTNEGQAESRAENVVFVYSAGGDVFGETLQGERVVLADGPEDEVWPSLSPDGTELLYQLGSGPPGEIVHVDLETITTTSLGAGQYPSFGPDGRAAWVVNNVTDEPLIVIGRPSSEPEAEIGAIADWDGPIQVNPPLAWDLGGDYIYYTAGWEETSELYQTDSRGDPDPFPMMQEMALERGTRLAGPYVRDPSSVFVFRACCQRGIEDPWESFELGRVSFTEGGGVYETVLKLDPRQFPQTFVGWYPQVFSAGNLWRDEDTGAWSPVEERTWIVANQVEAWLLSEGGDSQYLSDALIHEYDYPTQLGDGVLGTFEGWAVGSAIEPD